MRTDAEVRAMVIAGHERNTKRDAIERSNGFATPADSDDGELARTAALALECGLKLDDWDFVAEAVAMLNERWGSL